MDIKADDYFAELEDLFNRTNDVDIAEIYDIFSHIFTRIADDCTRELKILFSGQFAKVDYLLKQNNISSELSYRIHDLRIRLKDTTKFNQNQLIELCPHDAFSARNTQDFGQKTRRRILQNSGEWLGQHLHLRDGRIQRP